MLPGGVSNPGPLTYESGALPIALRGPAVFMEFHVSCLVLFRAAKYKIILVFASERSQLK